MAIKVRHDGNSAAVIAAGAGSGRAKRRIETAKLAQNTPQHIQTLTPAHASAPGAGGGSAPLTHAPTGASVASAPLTHAPTPTPMGGGAGSRASSVRGGGAGVDLGEVKVTGDSIFTRPDKESQWNPATRRWERPWLPGEKEAEAAQRMNPVLAERAETQQALKDQSAEEEARRRREEWDRQHGILRQERDADLIAAGTHEYGYSPEVQREYDRIVKEYNDGLGKRYKAGSDDDLKFRAQRDEKIAALPKTLVPRNDPEGMFKRNTFTDAQGRIFTTDGKLIYNPADAETRRMEFQQRQMDAEEKRYIDAVMKLQQGYRASEPVYKMDEYGEKPLTDENGNPIVEKWNSAYKPYTEEQQDAILRRLFPNRFANVQPAPTAQQPSPFQQALQNWLKNPLGTGAQPAQPTQPAPTAQQPAAHPESQAQPVIRQDSQGVSWEIVFDENGKPIGKRRR